VETQPDSHAFNPLTVLVALSGDIAVTAIIIACLREDARPALEAVDRCHVEDIKV